MPERVEDLQPDHDRLAGDAADVYLLQFLSRAEAAVAKLDVETVRDAAPELHSFLLKIITVQLSRAPRPARPVRRLISRILVISRSRAESPAFFDILQAISPYMADPKAYRDVRVACFDVAASLIAAHGAAVVSVLPEIISICIRVLKNSTTPVIVSAAALSCLHSSLSHAGHTLAEPTQKDLIKTLRSAITDKQAPLQRDASQCLLVAVQSFPSPLNSSDIDSTVALVLKPLENSDFQTRRSLCMLLAGLLASTQIEGSKAESVSKIKKPSSAEPEDDTYVANTTTQLSRAARKLMSLTDALRLISNAYNRPQAPRRTLTGLVDLYSTLFLTLGTGFVQDHYHEILCHLIEDIPPPSTRPNSNVNRFNILSHRRHIEVLLRDVIGSRILTEQGQISAIRDISETYLNTWPEPVSNKRPLDANSYVVLLSEISGLLSQLGSVPNSVQSSLNDPLLRFLTYPETSVQLSAASALRALCYASPFKLSENLSNILERLEQDIDGLSTSEEPSAWEDRAWGRAHGLSALFSLVPSRYLYVSLETPEKIMSLSTRLLKESAEHSLAISGVEIGIAWMLVTSLMTLGPKFFSSHLSHLQMLWKNALPKPVAKSSESGQSHSSAEWSFLLHVREAALTSIYQFLRTNGPRLLTQELSRRLVTLLSNTLAFADSFVAQNSQLLLEQSQHPTSSTSSSALGFIDRESRLRRRVYQCFVELKSHPATEPLQQSLVTTTLNILAEPDRYAGSQLQAAIHAQSGTFTSLWSQGDGFVYGVTSLLTDRGANIQEIRDERTFHRLNTHSRDPLEVAIDELSRTPIRGALEHDWLAILQTKPERQDSDLPPPEATGLVDAALELFTTYLPNQEHSVQIKVFKQMFSYMKSFKLERNPGRRAAIIANSVTAILGCLRSAMKESFIGSTVREAFQSRQLQTSLIDILNEPIGTADHRIRNAAAESCGRLCHLGGPSTMSNQLQVCVSEIVNNTDPYSRAGRARCLAEIYCHVGGMSASSFLKTIVDVLMSLSADAHPVVHYHALDSLASVINAAGLGYITYLNATLGMLVKLYYRDSHEPEGGSSSTVHLRTDLPTYISFCQILDGLIAVLGPELQESPLRSLVLLLSREFINEADEGVHVEALKTMQHLLLFSPDDLDLANLVQTVREGLTSARQPRKVASINSVYQLVQKNVNALAGFGGNQIVTDLFALLDDDPTLEGVKTTIRSWLTQTVSQDPNSWIDICQSIVSRVNASRQATDDAASQEVETNKENVEPEAGLARAIGFADEESQGIGIESSADDASTVGRGIGSRANIASAIPRWRTQRFALQCLHFVIIHLVQYQKTEHFDPRRARQFRMRPGSCLFSRVPELIKMAFTASTAQVMEIRLAGLVLLRDVIENFKRTPDVDFDDALLLEQHQAPIAAALTPAFSSESCPEVLASGIEICAVFVGSRIVQQVDKMGRILKLLTSALASCKESEMPSLAEVTNLSTSASNMLKTSVFVAWAGLQSSSEEADYLKAILEPHLAFLSNAWLNSLCDFSRQRVSEEVDAPGAFVALSDMDDSPDNYHSVHLLHKQWPPMLHAVAILLKANNKDIIEALRGDITHDSSSNGKTIKENALPTQQFWSIYGLAYECLSTSDSGSNPFPTQVSVRALQGLARPTVYGDTILSSPFFEEFIALCFRLIATEPCQIQEMVVTLIRDIVSHYKDRLFPDSHSASSVTPFSEENVLVLFLRVVFSVINQSMPSASNYKTFDANRVSVLSSALRAYCEITFFHPQELQEDLLAVPFYLYTQMLKAENVEVDLITPTLPVLKELCDYSFQLNKNKNSLPPYMRGMLACSLQNVDSMRSRSGKAVTVKTKGNLLAAVMILTRAPSSVKLSRASVEHCCLLINQSSSSDTFDILLTAIHCSQTLLMASTYNRSNPALRFCIGQIVPSLIEHVNNVASNDKDKCAPTNNDKDLSTVAFKQIISALESLLTLVPGEQSIYNVLIPTFLVLLNPNDNTGKDSKSIQHNLAIRSLLKMASTDPAAFKSVSNSLPTTDRERLETSIRKTLQSSNDQTDNSTLASSTTPTISLKSFG